MYRRAEADSKPFIQDVTLVKGTDTDEATGVMISDNAKGGLEQCVNDLHIGGDVLAFSMSLLAFRTNITYNAQ